MANDKESEGFGKWLFATVGLAGLVLILLVLIICGLVAFVLRLKYKHKEKPSDQSLAEMARSPNTTLAYDYLRSRHNPQPGGYASNRPDELLRILVGQNHPKLSQNVLLQTQNFINEVQDILARRQNLSDQYTTFFEEMEVSLRELPELDGSKAERFSDKVKELLLRLDLPRDIREFVTKVDCFLDENRTAFMPTSAITYRAQGAGIVVGPLPAGTEIPPKFQGRPLFSFEKRRKKLLGSQLVSLLKNV